MNATTEAIAIKIGNRFFYRTTAKRVLTAWSLAGAMLFMPDNEHKISAAEDTIIKRGYTPIRVKLKIV